MHNGVCHSFLPKYERQTRLLFIHDPQRRQNSANLPGQTLPVGHKAWPAPHHPTFRH